MARRSLSLDHEMFLDFLVLVLSCLPCIADRESFASVCTLWRRAAGLSDAPPPAQLPWAIFPSATAASTVFSILSASTRRIYLPTELVGARLCGSHPGAWVAATGHVPSGGNVAINLLSREMVPLPNKKLVPLSRRRAIQLLEGEGPEPWIRQRAEKDVAVRAIAFSDAPNTPDCVAAAITQGVYQPSVAMCWLGAQPQYWAVPWTIPAGVQDVVYFEVGGNLKPSFYLITNWDALFVASFVDDTQILVHKCRVQWPTDDMPTLPANVYTSRYLVVSRGHLLMVRRYYSYSKSDGTHQTMLFRVFELQNQTLDLSWLELDSLGSRALFLARCSSRAFELPANSEIKPGSIFFLNDITFGESVAATKNDNQYNRNDMGVYYKDEPGLTWPHLCSNLFGAKNFVAFMKHEGKMEIMLFDNLQELETYVGNKPIEVEIKGCIRRFNWEQATKCPTPIWFAH